MRSLALQPPFQIGFRGRRLMKMKWSESVESKVKKDSNQNYTMVGLLGNGHSWHGIEQHKPWKWLVVFFVAAYVAYFGFAQQQWAPTIIAAIVVLLFVRSS